MSVIKNGKRYITNNTMKKYRVTKEHLYLKEGIIFEQNSSGNYYTEKYANGTTLAELQEYIESNPTWFEEVKSERWKPDMGQQYFYVLSDGTLGFDIFFTRRGIDDDRYRFGNMFETEEQAQEAQEKVKALLLNLHKV